MNLFVSAILAQPVVDDDFHFVFSHYIPRVIQVVGVGKEFVFHFPWRKTAITCRYKGSQFADISLSYTKDQKF